MTPRAWPSAATAASSDTARRRAPCSSSGSPEDSNGAHQQTSWTQAPPSRALRSGSRIRKRQIGHTGSGSVSSFIDDRGPRGAPGELADAGGSRRRAGWSSPRALRVPAVGLLHRDDLRGALVGGAPILLQRDQDALTGPSERFVRNHLSQLRAKLVRLLLARRPVQLD